ncbi:MAG: glycosyltransferase family 2 protein [Bacteroidetes bacterium]|uniref:glycosyltransferase family 2 protein n=1 Tax=Phnomibacter sp. TaxID=2836217 RepID=UPI002FDEDB47|nr:glycosyltransferase family 2 protein [Bacteroidota bacterium]
MNTLLHILLWSSLAIVIYTYFGYGVITYLLVRAKQFFGKTEANKLSEKPFQPSVSLIIAAYNEADCIQAKIENSLSQQYPAEQLEIIVITDGSDDATPAIVSGFEPRVKLMHQPARMGKTAALNRAVAHASNEILIFSDANTMLNKDAVANIAKHYSNPKVGGVSGEKRIVSAIGVGAVAEEGLYWKYESFLKKLDSDLHTVVGAAGELFSVRKSLYEAVGNNIILDDFYISLGVCERGYLVKYEPTAYGEELPSQNVKEEEKRKIRIAAGGFQAMQIFASLMNPLRFGMLSFQYVSHRVLRWALCPFLLPVILLSNLLLVLLSPSLPIQLLLIAQVAFYSLAIAGGIFNRLNISYRILNVPYYFLFMNVAVYFGLKKFLQNNQSAVWERSARTKLSA